MRKELQWLRNALLGLNMQGMIVSNPKNIEYLTGVKAEGILLITRKENIFITDGRYTEYVHSVLTIEDEIVVYDTREISIYDYENFFTFCENVGFEEHYVTYAKYKELADKDEKVIFGGRLGGYKYYDMDKVIEEALKICKQTL